MEKVAVLIPTYNRVTLLPDCLESICRQTHHNITIFIYDDGSNDGTCDFIKRLGEPRIIYHRDEKNYGVSYARNKLLKQVKASGIEFACWQDSDDMSNIYRIEMQLKALKGESHVYVTSCHARLGICSKNECFRYPVLAPKDGYKSFASTMFRCETAVSFIDGVDYGGEDYYWRRDMELAGHEFVNVPYRLYHIRLSNRDRIGVLKRSHPERRLASYVNRRKNRNMPDV